MRANRRSAAIDLLRIFSAFFVIYNHTTTYGFTLFATQEVGSFSFWSSLFVSIFCKFAVPVFYTISGAMLLDKEDSFKNLFCRRLLRVAILLLIFSALYYVIETNNQNGTLSLVSFAKTFYSSQIISPLWFLYPYMAFLISLPFLRAMVAQMENKHFIYMIVLCLLLKDVRMVLEYVFNNATVTMNPNLRVNWLTTDIIFYPCLGYFLHRRCKPDSFGRHLPWMWLVNILCICLCCALTYLRILRTGECTPAKSQYFHGTFVLVNCITLFATAHYLVWRFPPSVRFKSILSTVSGCTLGVYLLHPLFINRIKPFARLWHDFYQLPVLPPLLKAFPMCLSIFLVCFGITWLLKKIELFRKLL